MNSAKYHSLKIRDLSLQVSLGCSAEERKNLQEVRVSVELRFPVAPVGLQSDDLADTICYARISEAFKKHVEAKEFCLVEKIANDLFGITEKIIEGRAGISLVAHKVKPPVENLLGGVEYQLGNF